jgi:hypothetical protein
MNGAALSKIRKIIRAFSIKAILWNTSRRINNWLLGNFLNCKNRWR